MLARGGKRYAGLVIVLGLALLSWWFKHQERFPEVSLQRVTHVVDYSIADFEVTVMDDAGKPSHQLRAQLMRHYADDDSAEVVQPRLLLYRSVGQGTEGGAEERWQLQAEKAQLYHGGAEMLLQGDVQMQRLGEAGSVTLELATRDLWVYPGQDRAESAEEVEIRERRGTTRAQGLKIDLKEGRLDLLAAVRGEYVLEQ